MGREGFEPDYVKTTVRYAMISPSSMLLYIYFE